MSKINKQIILNSRPHGIPTPSNFSLIETSMPSIKQGEVLLQTLYLSVDPYMRGRMNDKITYIQPFVVGKPLTGGIVARVVESKTPDYRPDDIVQGFLEWSDYNVAKGSELRKLNPQKAPVSTALGVLGMPGMTAYVGLLDFGKPQKGETIVVSGAAGAVGSIVGQIAKIYGCRVVGIAGGKAKTEYLVHELGFDAAVDYKQTNYPEEIKRVCPNGVDIYFDNVGGDITDHILKLINKHARIVICGQISMYNLDQADVGPRNFWILLVKSALAQGFIVSDYEDRFPEGIRQMTQWLGEGKIKYKETIAEGLENAPRAFIGLFAGENTGKQLVRVSS